MTRVPSTDPLRSARAALVALALGGAGCGGARADDTGLDGFVAGAPGVALSLEARSPQAGGGLDVRWTLVDDEPLADPFLIAVPTVWAGRSGFDADLRSIEVVSADGQPLDITPGTDGLLRVDTEPSTFAIELRYTLRPRQRLLTEASRFRALMTADVLYAPGHALLMQPISAGAAALQQVRLTLGTGIAVRSTLGDGGLFSMEELVDAAYFSGHYLHEAREGVDVWLAPGVTPTPGALADAIARVVAALSPIVGPRMAPTTTALVLPREDDPDALSGHGRRGGFVLEIGATAAADATDELVQLVGHEHLHRLIGHGLRFDANEEIATLWFREGLTEYLAVSALVRARLLPETALFAHIGTSVTNLRGNPASSQGTPEAGQYWTDRDLRRLPYDRGALLAMLIDLALIRDHATTLEAFVAWMGQDEASLAEPLTSASIRDALERFTGRSWEAWWSEKVDGGADLGVFEALAAVGIDVVERLEPAPFHGFRANVTAAGRWYVSDVTAGGPAERAGLAVGMELAGPPEMPSGRRPRPAWVRLTVGGVERAVAIEPESGQRRSHVLVESQSAAGDWRTGFALPPR